MANKNNKHKDNVEGDFYVDESCIDCDLCQQIAPENFKRNNDGGYVYVGKQPENEAEIFRCKKAMRECPVESIGDDGKENQPYSPIDSVNLFIKEDKEIENNIDFLKKLIFTAVCFILSEQLGLDSDKIELKNNLIDDFGIDEMDMVEVIMRLEEDFEIEFSPEDEEKFKTVEDLIDYIATEKIKQIPSKD